MAQRKSCRERKYMSAVLTVQNMTLVRGGRTLVRGLNFEVRSGDALLLTGANGAGKSTLLRAIAGLFTPASGAISISGDDIEDDENPALQAHYVGHSDALKGALSARENLDFWAAALKRRGGLDPLQALAAVNLAHVADLPVGWLSAGQRRRTALARLFVAERPLWLLDEPTTALDAASQTRLAQSMAAHRAKGGMIIAATHAPVGLEDAAELRLGAPA